MSGGIDDVFTAFRDPQLARAAQLEQQQARFEEHCIKNLLRYANVQIHAAELARNSQESFNTRTLTFNWFHHYFPGFPVWMGSAKLKLTAGTHISCWAYFGSDFMKLPWMREYMQLTEQLGKRPIDNRVALMFNAPHADKSQTMVLHNQPVQAQNTIVDPEQRDETETRILRPYGNPRITYVLESFRSFMQTVGTDWAESCHR